jgi:hypothetical protein
VTCTALRLGASALSQRQSARKERAETGNSRECNQRLAQLRTDPKSRRLRWLGVLARNGFVSKKALGQMLRLWNAHNFLFRARRERCPQFGLGLLIAATTANTVAVFERFPRSTSALL